MLFNFFFNLGSKNVSIFFFHEEERHSPRAQLASVARPGWRAALPRLFPRGWSLSRRVGNAPPGSDFREPGGGAAPRGDRGESPFPDGGSSGFITDEKQTVYVIFMWERIRDTFYLRKAQR